jgi:hypothetical protein
MSFKRYLSLSTIALLACTGASAASLLPEGQYSVPVEPRLQALATFPLNEIIHRETEGIVTLSYDLPIELTGVAHDRVWLRGDSKSGPEFKMSGPRGEGSCFRSEKALSCSVNLTPVRIDRPHLEEKLRQISSSPAEVLDRLEVARTFESDPIGIVTYIE